MTSLAWLIPAALALGGLGLAAFLWSLKSGQYDDLDGAAWRALEDRAPHAHKPAGREKDREEEAEVAAATTRESPHQTSNKA